MKESDGLEEVVNLVLMQLLVDDRPDLNGFTKSMAIATRVRTYIAGCLPGQYSKREAFIPNMDRESEASINFQTGWNAYRDAVKSSLGVDV